MTDNPFSKPRHNKQDYLIVFGDPDKFLEYAKIPPSHSLKITPFVEKLKKKANVDADTLTEALIESNRPCMIFLFGYFKDFESMKKACDEDPGLFMMSDLDDLDDEDLEGDGIGYRVFGVGRELYTVEMDVQQAAAGHQIDHLRFPDSWEICKAPLLLRSGEVKSVDRGFSGMLDKRVLDFNIYKWAKERNIDVAEFDTLVNLPHVNMTTAQLLNTEALKSDPNAPFTVYIKKTVKEKRPVLRTV